MNKLSTQNNTAVSSENIMFNPQSMEMLHSMAKVMATAICTLPKHLQGNIGDCFAIAMQASAWGMSPYAVGQKTHLVNGILGYEAQLVAAVITSSNAIDGHFHYEYGGDWKSDSDPTSWVRVGAKIRGDSDITWGERLYVAKVTTKNSPVWKSDPKQQGAYLALKKWSRLYTPALIMGVYTSDELVEIEQPEKEVNAPPSDKPIQSMFEATKAKVNSLTIDQLAQGELMKHIDITSLNADEKTAIKGLITSRRKELKESAVVADIKPSTKPDWKQLLSDAQSDEEFNAIVASMNDDEIKAAIDNTTTKEQLTRIYMAVPINRKEKFNDDVDFKNDMLGQ